jgi:transcriptional regulator with PAS, ATPase and Fis domain
MFLTPTTDFHDPDKAIVPHKTISHHLKRSGFRLGDHIRIKPITGRKRTLKSNKTKYIIVSESIADEVDLPNKIILPSLKDEDFLLELTLFHHEKISRNESNCRYLIQSKNKVPFILNHQLVYSAFVDRGDKVSVSNNLLEFVEKEINEYKEFWQVNLEENRKIINSELPILIEGETGTGKTHLASMIHQMSGKLGPFVHINLSSFSPSLLESELFGHKKSAFTGAIKDKTGAFSEAQDGTLFIDEIDSLPWEIQTKLLLFLDNQKVRAVGDNVDKIIKTRIIFSSGQALNKLVEKGRMRKDFYYRLHSGKKMKLKSLRDNTKYITLFCQNYAIKHDLNITTKLIDFYTTLPWPGNFRELKSHLDRKRVLAENRKLDFDEVDQELIAQSSEISNFVEKEDYMTLEELRNGYAYKVYMEHNQHLKHTALTLGVNTKTLRGIPSEVRP